MKKIRVTIWNEFRHEKTEEDVKALYPDGIHAFIKNNFAVDAPDFDVTLASLDDDECGLPDNVLENTDVLMWWGHMFHNEVPNELVEKIADRVFRFGMGFIAMHSAHVSKPFQRIVGANGYLSWGEEQQELIWNVMPSHPIASGIPEHFELEMEEMYGEPQENKGNKSDGPPAENGGEQREYGKEADNGSSLRSEADTGLVHALILA